MYIRNIRIENYRNFRCFQIDLQKFTLIIGENNIGKTNLMNAVGIIFSQDITFFKKRMLEIDDINYFTVEEFKKLISVWKEGDEIPKFPEVIIEITLTDFRNCIDHESIVADWIIDTELKEARLTYSFSYRGDKKAFLLENKEKKNR